MSKILARVMPFCICISHFTACIGEETGGWDYLDWLYCRFWLGQPLGNYMPISTLSALAVMCFLFCDIFSPIGTTRHSMSLIGEDCCQSKLVNVVSCVPLGSVLGPQSFFLYTAKVFSVYKYELYLYANSSTLVAIALSESICCSVHAALS